MGGARRRPRKNPSSGGGSHGAGAGAGSRRRALPTRSPPSDVETPNGSQHRCGRNPGSCPPRGIGNAFAYTYPSAAHSGGILLAGSSGGAPPLAASDHGPVVPSYSYGAALVGGLGLGSPDEAEGDDQEVVGGAGLGFGIRDEDEEEEERVGEGDERIEGVEVLLTPEVDRERKNEGFLSIGGIRIYTEDTSSPDEEFDVSEDDDSDDDEDGDSIEEEEEEEDKDEDEGEEEGGSSEENGLSSKDDSDIDVEIAEDYMEGVGGGAELLTAHWLAAMKLDENGFLKSGGSSGQKKGKLGGIDLLNALEQYGMKQTKVRKGKGNAVGGMSNLPDINLLTFDDMFMAKDTRSHSRRKQTPAHISRSWPCEGRKSKKYGSAPGEKKKHRKELIALKRRQRMINRGVDLEQINRKLRQMVVDDVDMLSFQPMHSRDCSQVQRLASVYRIQSGCQGSGKKRFVTVTRTGQTCLPSSADKIRLDRLLGVGIDEDVFAVNPGKKIKPQAQFKPSASNKLAENHKFSSGEKNGSGKKSSALFAARPVSFISSGTMQVDSTIETVAVDSNASTSPEKAEEDASAKLGAFEMHTKGFGSRMMARMGFVEGHGLGKDGQGMVQPIEAIQRPKSLGLGVQFAAGTSDAKDESRSFATFEKHTKGFGSRMMNKMGFVPGTGLGKDGQGITDPLTAVRRPKLRGLGVKG